MIFWKNEGLYQKKRDGEALESVCRVPKKILGSIRWKLRAVFYFKLRSVFSLKYEEIGGVSAPSKPSLCKSQWLSHFPAKNVCKCI